MAERKQERASRLSRQDFVYLALLGGGDFGAEGGERQQGVRTGLARLVEHEDAAETDGAVTDAARASH